MKRALRRTGLETMEKVIQAKGTGFSPYISAAISERALASEGGFWGILSLLIRPKRFALCYPTLATKTKASRGWGTQTVSQFLRAGSVTEIEGRRVLLYRFTSGEWWIRKQSLHLS
jgi:hypothetical protein